MKVYILKETDFEELRKAVEFEKFRELAKRPEDKPIIEQVYRRLNYELCRWIDKAKKED